MINCKSHQQLFSNYVYTVLPNRDVDLVIHTKINQSLNDDDLTVRVFDIFKFIQKLLNKT